MFGREKKKNSDAAGITLRVFLLIFSIAGLVLNIITTSGCSFLRYERSFIPEGTPDLTPDDVRDIDVADIGLYRYDPNLGGCRSISDDFSSSAISWQFNWARVGAHMATGFAALALFLLLFDFIFTRFICSRLWVSASFLLAFLCQCFTFLAFAGDICDANFKNGPYPCSPKSGTWISTSATVMFLMASIFICCIPQNTPIGKKIKDSLKNDEKDGCCFCCRKKEDDEDDLEEGEAELDENGEEKKKGGFFACLCCAKNKKAKKEEEETPTEEEEEEVRLLEDIPLEEQQAQVVVTAALAAARRGKQGEIEKQLEMLTAYKDHLPEGEYEEKAAILLRALPDPETYEHYTKMDFFVDPKKEDDGDEFFEVEPEEEKEEEVKKGGVKGAFSAVGAAAHTVTHPSTWKKKTEDPQDPPIPEEVPGNEA